MKRYPVYILMIVLLLVTTAVFASDTEEDQELPPLHHVVKVKPPKSMEIAAGFPLNEKGEIDCKTCHGIKDIEKTPFDKVDEKAANFHRGGPYSQLSEFCYNCHKKKAYQRPNIHILLDEQGKYEKKDCEYCHEEAPDPKKEIKRDELKFRLAPEKLCFGCHLKTPHLNALTHQVEPDKEMLKRIAASEKKLGVILPLDENGKIMCVTCHTPHQKGLIDEATPAGKQVEDVDLEKGVEYQDHSWNEVFIADKEARLKELTQQGGEKHQLNYQRLEHEVLIRLSAKDGRLCMACHEFER